MAYVSSHGVLQVLSARRRAAGATPLLTYYDVPAGHRTELSATTFVNWVYKSANLLDELGAEPGDDVWVPLLAVHPGHWVGSVWAVACWLAGTSVAVSQPCDARIAVTGPEGLSEPFAGDVVACSLHPLGLGFTGVLPGDFDFADVLTQPDDYLVIGRDPDDDLVRPTWAGESPTVGDILSLPPRDDRFVIVPDDPRTPITEGTMRALLGTGGVVVISGGTPADIDHIATSERARTD